MGVNAGNSYDAETHNLAIGYAALSGSVAGGEYNVAVGNSTLDALTSGDYNTAVGYDAGTDLTTGERNTFIGHEAGKDCIGGGQNVCIGDSAGSGALSTSAGRNVAIGRNAGQSMTSGSGNVRYKEEIATSTAGLSFINDLRPVTFKWKKEKDLPSDHESYVEGSDTRVMLSTGETNHGFIAQEVKAAIDAHSEIKDGFKMWSEEQRYDIDGNVIAGGRQRVAPSELIPVLTKAVQELSAQVTTLQNEVNTLKGE